MHACAHNGNMYALSTPRAISAALLQVTLKYQKQTYLLIIIRRYAVVGELNIYSSNLIINAKAKIKKRTSAALPGIN